MAFVYQIELLIATSHSPPPARLNTKRSRKLASLGLSGAAVANASIATGSWCSSSTRRCYDGV